MNIHNKHEAIICPPWNYTNTTAANLQYFPVAQFTTAWKIRVNYGYSTITSSFFQFTFDTAAMRSFWPSTQPYGSQERHSDASPNSLLSLAKHSTSKLRQNHFQSVAELAPKLCWTHPRTFAEITSEASPNSLWSFTDVLPKSPPKRRQIGSEALLKSIAKSAL